MRAVAVAVVFVLSVTAINLAVRMALPLPEPVERVVHHTVYEEVPVEVRVEVPVPGPVRYVEVPAPAPDDPLTHPAMDDPDSGLSLRKATMLDALLRDARPGPVVVLAGGASTPDPADVARVEALLGPVECARLRAELPALFERFGRDHAAFRHARPRAQALFYYLCMGN